MAYRPMARRKGVAEEYCSPHSIQEKERGMGKGLGQGAFLKGTSPVMCLPPSVLPPPNSRFSF